MLRRSLYLLRKGRCICSAGYFKFHASIYPVLHPRVVQDLPNPNLPTPASRVYGAETDILMDQLKRCQSVDRLLELVNMHLNIMNSKHVVLCLELIHDYIKDNNALSKILLDDQHFKSLCSRLMKVIRLFDPQEVISTYKTLCALELRSNTYVMQSVLKMLGAHLNSMSLGQLTFLSFLLHKQRHNNLVDGLRLALPLVLQVQIDQQLDSEHLTEVVNCLQLACRAGLRPATVQKIVNCISSKASLLSTSDAVTVIFSLLNIDMPVNGYSELMNLAFEIVTKNIEEMSPTKLNTILRTCCSQHFSHFGFFSTLADRIVSQKWNLELAYSALSSFSSIGFCPPSILDYFANIICLESEECVTKSLYSPLNCIEYLTALSHRPPKVDEAARILYSDTKKLTYLRTKMPHLCVKFHSRLAMLGHFPQQFLSNILNEEFLCNAWSCSKKLGKSAEFENQILSMFWCFNLYNVTANFIIPPLILKKVIHSVFRRHFNADYPFAKFIEKGLGGPQFLLSGVFTEDGHVIDHIVAMRSGNFPVALRDLKTEVSMEDKSVKQFLFVEDVILPEDAKIVAIIVAKEKDYIAELDILRSWVDLRVRCLAKKNYATLVINYTVWDGLPDREKISYLMREIKQALPGDDCALWLN